MGKIDGSNIVTYVFYALLLGGVGYAETVRLVPPGTVFGLLGGLGFGHGAATVLATKSTLRETTTAMATAIQATPPAEKPVVVTPTIAIPAE